MSGRVLFDELTKLQNFFEAPRLTHDLCSGHSEGFQLGLLAALDQSLYSFFEFITTIQ